MSRFTECLPRVLKSEGGFVDHPKDPGGATMKGITWTTLRRWNKEQGLSDPTLANLKAISDQTIAQIYATWYWTRAGCDLLPIGLDFAMFDFAVNSGAPRAVESLQRIVEVDADGYVGPVTVEAVARFGVSPAIIGLCAVRLQFLRGLETWMTFRGGWINRVQETEHLSLADAKRSQGPVDAEPPAPPAPVDHPMVLTLRTLAEVVDQITKIVVKQTSKSQK